MLIKKKSLMNGCSICGDDFEGMGNNPDPINDGRCCDKCDCLVVIPARLMQLGVGIHAAIGVGRKDYALRKALIRERETGIPSRA